MTIAKFCRIPSTILYANAPEYYDHLFKLIEVRFVLLSAPLRSDMTPEFVLPLRGDLTYDQFSTAVGEHLDIASTRIEFSRRSGLGGVVSPSTTQTLKEILAVSPATIPTMNTLYFKILEYNYVPPLC